MAAAAGHKEKSGERIEKMRREGTSASQSKVKRGERLGWNRHAARVSGRSVLGAGGRLRTMLRRQAGSVIRRDGVARPVRRNARWAGVSGRLHMQGASAAHHQGKEMILAGEGTPLLLSSTSMYLRGEARAGGERGPGGRR